MNPLARLFTRRPAAPPMPEIFPRSAWADADPVGPIVAEDDVRFLLTHHTGSRNNYRQDEIPTILRTIYTNHTGQDSGGAWPDIAYNFMIDKFGGIWEGRAGSIAGPVRGDATGGSQGHAVLACWLGKHHDDPPTDEAIDAMIRLWAWQSHLHGIDVRPGSTTSFVSRGSSRRPAGETVTTPTIAGHRDMSETTCPGDAGYEVVRGLQASVTERLR